MATNRLGIDEGINTPTIDISIGIIHLFNFQAAQFRDIAIMAGAETEISGPIHRPFYLT
ncbi:MAG TPA: hypothetical protein VHS80_07400 [Chthoniobacterales bacterium]|nr:hypothetical protein [Chthoniobacterales bacterium]